MGDNEINWDQDCYEERYEENTDMGMDSDQAAENALYHWGNGG